MNIHQDFALNLLRLFLKIKLCSIGHLLHLVPNLLRLIQLTSLLQQLSANRIIRILKCTTTLQICIASWLTLFYLLAQFVYLCLIGLDLHKSNEILLIRIVVCQRHIVANLLLSVVCRRR